MLPCSGLHQIFPSLVPSPLLSHDMNLQFVESRHFDTSSSNKIPPLFLSVLVQRPLLHLSPRHWGQVTLLQVSFSVLVLLSYSPKSSFDPSEHFFQFLHLVFSIGSPMHKDSVVGSSGEPSGFVFPSVVGSAGEPSGFVFPSVVGFAGEPSGFVFPSVVGSAREPSGFVFTSAFVVGSAGSPLRSCFFNCCCTKEASIPISACAKTHTEIAIKNLNMANTASVSETVVSMAALES